MGSGIIASYQNTVASFPDHSVSEDDKLKGEKGLEWHRQYCEAMFGQYVNDQGGILYSKKQDMQIARAYGQGNQSNTKYMDILCPKDKTGSRKGLYNVSWDIVSPAPKLREVAIGTFLTTQYGIAATAINESAGADREQMKWQMFASKKLAPFLTELDETLGEGQMMAGGQDYDVDSLPDTQQELETLMEVGSFKLTYETAIQNALIMSFYDSRWQTEIKRKLFEDLLDCAVAGVKNYVEPATQRVMCRYVDVANAIVSHSTSRTYKDKSYAGEVLWARISKLREMAPELDDDVWKEVENKYSGYNTNPYLWGSYAGGASNYEVNTTGNSFDVMYLDAEWMSYTMKERAGDKEGKMPTKSKIGNKENRKQDATKMEMVHKASWIVGTEYIFNWGYQHDIPRKNKREAVLSYNFFRVAEKSKMSSIIPLLDDLFIDWLRMQNAKRKASQAGLAIEFGSLTNISLGGNKMKPLEVLSIRRTGGDLLYRATTHHSQMNYSAAKPVQELEGGIGRYFQELIASSEITLSMIREVLGISEFMDTSSGDANTPVAHAKMAIGASNNVLKTIYDGYKYIHEETANSIALRFQMLAKYGDISGYAPALGENALKLIKISADISNRQYAIMLYERPSEEHIMKILDDAKESMKMNKMGGVGITMADYLQIYRILMSTGNIEHAMIVLARKEKLQQELTERTAQQNSERQEQAMVALEKEKQETMKVEKKLELDNSMAIEKAKSDLRINEKKEYHKLEMLQLDKQKEIQVESATAANIN